MIRDGMKRWEKGARGLGRKESVCIAWHILCIFCHHHHHYQDLNRYIDITYPSLAGIREDDSRTTYRWMDGLYPRLAKWAENFFSSRTLDAISLLFFVTSVPQFGSWNGDKKYVSIMIRNLIYSLIVRLSSCLRSRSPLFKMELKATTLHYLSNGIITNLG